MALRRLIRRSSFNQRCWVRLVHFREGLDTPALIAVRTAFTPGTEAVRCGPCELTRTLHTYVVTLNDGRPRCITGTRLAMRPARAAAADCRNLACASDTLEHSRTPSASKHDRSSLSGEAGTCCAAAQWREGADGSKAGEHAVPGRG